LEGSIDIGGVKKDMGSDPPVGVDFDDSQHLDGEFSVPRVSIERADAGECEALPASRDPRQGHLRKALGQCSHTCYHDIATVPEADIYHSTSIFDETVGGQDFGYRRPIACARVVKESAFCPACCVLQPSRLALQLIEF